MSNKANVQAKRLLDSCGLDEITDMPMETFVAGLDAILVEEALSNCDGKIIFGKNKTVIKVNSNIQFVERKRFVIAHEIGHLVMHKNMQLPDDTFANFNIISGMEKILKMGVQEVEANEFASELLMPSSLFIKEAQNKKFSPLLIKQLSQRFKTSLTATIFRYLQLDLYPIFIAYVERGKIKYWKRSDSFKAWPLDINRLPPPSDSVAAEYISKDYSFLYTLEEKAQQVSRSTWFEPDQYNEDIVEDFYEYCIPTKKYQVVLSIVWQD